MGSRSAWNQVRGTTLSRSPSGCGCGSARPNQAPEHTTLGRGHSHIPSAGLRTRSLSRSLSPSLRLILSREDSKDISALSQT